MHRQTNYIFRFFISLNPTSFLVYKYCKCLQLFPVIESFIHLLSWSLHKPDLTMVYQLLHIGTRAPTGIPVLLFLLMYFNGISVLVPMPASVSVRPYFKTAKHFSEFQQISPLPANSSTSVVCTNTALLFMHCHCHRQVWLNQSRCCSCSVQQTSTVFFELLVCFLFVTSGDFKNQGLMIICICANSLSCYIIHHLA